MAKYFTGFSTFDSPILSGDPGPIDTGAGKIIVPGIISDASPDAITDLTDPTHSTKTGGPKLPPGVPDFEVASGIIDHPTIFSKASSVAPFCSLYNSFKFEAEPHYNFYVEDEETNGNSERRIGQKLEDIPRYILLKWRKAPTTDKSPKVTKAPPSTKLVRSSTFLVNRKSKSTSGRGLRFDGIDLKKFDEIKNSTVNGFVNPGVISAVIEMPRETSNQPQFSLPKIDEDKFLELESTKGLSIHDTQSNINTEILGIFSAQRMSTSPTSEKTKAIKGEMFDGKFSVLKSLSSDSQLSSMTIKGVATSSPALSIKFASATKASPMTSLNETKSDPLFEVAGQLLPSEQPRTQEMKEVSFVDPAITGLVSKNKVDLVRSPEHAENIVAIGQNLTSLFIFEDMKYGLATADLIPSFPATQEDSGTEYVGYVIEKYEMGADGVFKLLEEIDIPDVEMTKYIDTKIKYGKMYRYRIKTILKWTRRGNVTHEGFEEGNFFDDEFTSTKLLASYKSSYFSSEWNREWKYASCIDTLPPDPPDEFTVRPESHKKRVVVTWKLPANPQKDITYFRLFRKEQTEDGLDLSGWHVIAISPGPKNSLVLDNDVEFLQANGNIRYVYAAQTITAHNEYSKLSCQTAVRLNERYQDSGEFPVQFVSEEGISLTANGQFSTKPPKRHFEEIIPKDIIALTSRNGNREKPFSDHTIVLRVESLDTNQKREIKIAVQYDNVDPNVKETTEVVNVDLKPPIGRPELHVPISSNPVSLGTVGSVTSPTTKSGTKSQF